MINKKMGFLESYLLGLAPSKIPPCGVARRVEDGEADAEAVTVFVTTEAIIEDMVDGYEASRGRTRLRLTGGKSRQLLCRDEKWRRSCLCKCVKHYPENTKSA
jgi:hypothetical protein